MSRPIETSSTQYVGSFFGKITGQSDFDDNQWTYAFEEVYLTDTGAYNKWVTRTGGLTGTARNYVEVLGGKLITTVVGCGVDVSRLEDTGFEVKPIPANRIVKIDIVERIDSEGKRQRDYWFDAINAVDGDCV